MGKAAIRYVKDTSWNAYLKFYFNKQIKTDFLTKTDNLDKKYADDIDEYWGKIGQNINNDWHTWYSSRNSTKDVRYIPEDIFYCKILPFYNRLDLKQAYCDKAQLGTIFPNIKRPVTIVNNFSGVNYDDSMNLLSTQEVIEICSQKKKLFIKPSIDSGGGRSIEILESNNVVEMSKKIKNVLSKNIKNFVIQEEINQHKILNQINKTSVNTIRPITFFDGKEVYILSSILRMGINGAKTDSESSGGISCGINSNGKLKSTAYDRYGNDYPQHPQGHSFKNTKIPSYEEIEKIIKKEHKKFGHFKIISWDFAIDDTGEPVLIEYNLGMQGINFHQMNNGPLFGEITDEVLSQVYK